MIRSRWEISANQMSSKQVEYLLRQNTGLIHTIVRSYSNKFPQINYDDLICIARERFWLAIKEYDPTKGKLSTYATFQCRSYIREHIRKELRRANYEINVHDQIEFGHDGVEDKTINALMVDRVFSSVSEESRMTLLTCFYLGETAEECARRLGVTTHRMKRRVATALEEARSCLAAH